MKKKILSFCLILVGLSAFFSFAAQAQDISQTVGGLDLSASKVQAFKAQVAKPDSEYKNFISTKTGQVIGLVLSFIGVLFFGLMIYAGILWMTAAGNDQQISQSKNLLVNATIGIIIVFAAYAITVFLGSKFAQQ